MTTSPPEDAAKRQFLIWFSMHLARAGSSPTALVLDTEPSGVTCTLAVTFMADLPPDAPSQHLFFTPGEN